MKNTTNFGKEVLLVVIYSYKFTDFRYDLMGLGDFKRYCDVVVLDLSMIIAPKFTKAISVKRSEKKEVVKVSSFLSFIRHIYRLRKRTSKINISIFNQTRYGSFSGVLCNLIITAFLKKKCVVFDAYNGGVPIHHPIHHPNELVHNSHFIAKVLQFCKHTTKFAELRRSIFSNLFGLLERSMPSATTHRLVAGEDWIEPAKRRMPKHNKVSLVFGHSNDYSNMLLHEMKSPMLALSPKRTSVLLDAATPMFKGDNAITDRRCFLTSDVWYPLLCKFFGKLEAETDVNIEIAGHYRSAHPAIAPCFGNRPVYYGKTRELVLNSEFVVTRISTATSYAVMFRKPILFIYSNQLKEDYLEMQEIRGMAATLGTEPVNVDDPPTDIGRLLRIDEGRYRNYEKRCLTSNSSQRPNVQIILEDIMNVNTGFDFAKKKPDQTIK